MTKMTYRGRPSVGAHRGRGLTEGQPSANMAASMAGILVESLAHEAATGQRENLLGMAWAFEASKPLHDTPLARPHLLFLSKQFYQLGSKCLNTYEPVRAVPIQTSTAGREWRTDPGSAHSPGYVCSRTENLKEPVRVCSFGGRRGLGT